MTYEECAVLALQRLSDLNGHYPASRMAMYRRIGVRQREIFLDIARVNQEYFGVQASVDLSNGEADLNDLVDPVPPVALISLVQIEDPGTSGYPVGHPVAIVPIIDTDAAIPPRMVLRDNLFAGVGEDMDGVESIVMFYSRLPKMPTASSAATRLDLDDPYADLLVLDLAAWLVKKARRMDSGARENVLAEIAGEVEPLWDDLVQSASAHSPIVSRFSRPPAGVADKGTTAPEV